MEFMNFNVKKLLKLHHKEKINVNVALVNIVFLMTKPNKMSVKVIKLLEIARYVMIIKNTVGKIHKQQFSLVLISKKKNLKVLISVDVRWMKYVLMENVILKEFLVDMKKELLQYFVVLTKLV